MEENVMLTIGGNILASLLWGGVLSLLLVFILYRAARLLYSLRSLQCLGQLAFGVLWLFLFAQSSMLVGGLYVSGCVDDAEEWVNGQLAESGAAGQAVSVEEALCDAYPALSSYIHQVSDGTAETAATAGPALLSGIKSSVRYYILRRILWMTGGIVVGLALPLLFRPKPYVYHEPDDWE